MRHFIRSFVLVSAVVLTPQFCVANLIVNGDFEAGNTGFSSQYPNAQQTGGYQIVSNPHNWNSGFASFGDHTTGSGLMMAVDGATTSGRVVWQETITATTSQAYEFEGWVASMVSQSPAQLNFFADSNLIGVFGAPATTGIWTPFSITADLNAGPITLRIVDSNTSSGGNDFALDDLVVQAIPEPSTLALVAIAAVALCYVPRRRELPRAGPRDDIASTMMTV